MRPDAFGLLPLPGLRHNRQRLGQLARLGYVALDANAWLSKGQKIRDGAIILVHGNGDDPPVVLDKFTKWLKNNKKYRIVAVDRFIPAVFPSGKT